MTLGSSLLIFVGFAVDSSLLDKRIANLKLMRFLKKSFGQRKCRQSFAWLEAGPPKAKHERYLNFQDNDFLTFAVETLELTEVLHFISLVSLG